MRPKTDISTAFSIPFGLIRLYLIQIDKTFYLLEI